MNPKILPGWYTLYQGSPVVLGDGTEEGGERRLPEELAKEVEKKKEEAEKLLKEAEEKLKEAEEEARKIVSRAREEAEGIVSEARRAAERIKEEAELAKSQIIEEASRQRESIIKSALKESMDILGKASMQYSHIVEIAYRMAKDKGFLAGKETGYSEAMVRLQEVRRLLLESIPSAVKNALEALKVPIEEFAKGLAHALWRKLTEDEASYVASIIERHLHELSEYGALKIYYGEGFSPEVVDVIKDIARKWGIEISKDPNLGRNFRIEYAYGAVEDGLDVRYARLVEELASKFGPAEYPGRQNRDVSGSQMTGPQNPDLDNTEKVDENQEGNSEGASA